MYNLLYPERRAVSADTLIGWAKDYLATEYMRANPHAEPAAIDENARVSGVDAAIELLQDAGVITLRRDDDAEDRGRDTGTYRGGYRIFRSGVEREDFGSDR